MTLITELDGKTETATLENLVVGDVWLCAGQSNMAGNVRPNKNGRYPEGTITEANYPGFRHKLTSDSDPWVASTPETTNSFKQVAFFFGRDVYREALVPIGIVAAAVGGSNVESWLNQEPNELGGNYQKLIAPIVGYGIRGMVWYQGESNTKDGLKYQPKLTSLIEGWRKAWKQGDFPFYIVQLPGQGAPPEEGADPAGGGDWAETRQAQFQTLAVKNTGMAVTIDIGHGSVHPPNKYDTGIRLARLALHNDYGFTKLVPTGPLYESQKIEGDTIRIAFQHAENGLMFAEKNGILPPTPTPERKLGWLAIQAKDGTWHAAEGKIDGSELLVSGKDVKEPIAVRYAYVSRPVGCMLYNKDGLPAAPFTTDETEGSRK
jgi:sialate O-acetylesterase